MTLSPIAPAVRAARRLSPSTVRATNFTSFYHCQLLTPEQCSRIGARRWESTGSEPPPAGGHLPSISTSKVLRTTREAALRTPGINWLDENGSSPLQKTIGGRETRKMKVYQAVRDAM